MTRRLQRITPHRYIPILVGLLVAWGLAWAQPVFAQDTGAAQEVLASVNQARADAGLGPLSLNPLLTQAAQGHVDDMLTNYVYGHYGSDGSSVGTRVARTGYAAQPWVSENWVSAGSAAGAMRWWMNDYIHRVNILTPNWHEIGIGVGSRGGEMIFVTVFSAGVGDGSVATVAAAAPVMAAEPPSVRIEPQAVPAEGLDYTVQGGDTLLAIGLRYGLPWERIADANALTERSLLQIGQVVHIPGSGVAAPAAKPAVETELYQVIAGDTLIGIANRRGVTWQEVAAVNGFGEDTILQIAQIIFVPKATVAVEPPVAPAKALIPGVGAPIVDGEPMAAAASVSLAEPPPDTTGTGGPIADGAWHTIAPGDTIISVALRYNLDWQALLALNGLEPDSLLQLGQRLRLR